MTIFTINEREFLENKNFFADKVKLMKEKEGLKEKKHNNLTKKEKEEIKAIEKKVENSMYQIRHNIRKKIELLKEDLKLVMGIDREQQKKLRLAKKSDLKDISESIIKYNPTFIKKIIEIRKLGMYLNMDKEDNKKTLERFLMDAFKDEKYLLPMLKKVQSKMKIKDDQNYVQAFKHCFAVLINLRKKSKQAQDTVNEHIQLYLNLEKHSLNYLPQELKDTKEFEGLMKLIDSKKDYYNK